LGAGEGKTSDTTDRNDVSSKVVLKMADKPIISFGAHDRAYQIGSLVKNTIQIPNYLLSFF
jgi:hypothetical protein